MYWWLNQISMRIHDFRRWKRRFSSPSGFLMQNVTADRQCRFARAFTDADAADRITDASRPPTQADVDRSTTAPRAVPSLQVNDCQRMLASLDCSTSARAVFSKRNKGSRSNASRLHLPPNTSLPPALVPLRDTASAFRQAMTPLLEKRQIRCSSTDNPAIRGDAGLTGFALQ